MTDSPIDAHPPDLGAGTPSLSEPAAQQHRVEDDASPDERRAWAITEARLRADLAEAKLDAAEVTRLPEITSLGPAEPVRFEDCLGRHWKWPFHRCRYWSVSVMPCHALTSSPLPFPSVNCGSVVYRAEHL
jgi:hypothetical protein